MNTNPKVDHTLTSPAFIEWHRKFTMLGAELKINVGIADEQLLALYFIEDKTPAAALIDFEKVLKRLDAINNSYQS